MKYDIYLEKKTAIISMQEQLEKNPVIRV